MHSDGGHSQNGVHILYIYMKKLFIFLLALPLVLTACSSDDDDNAGATSVVTFDQKQFTVANEGGDILVNLHNAKAVPELNYLGDASDWIELAQSAGGSYANDRKYYFHVAANESYESDRTGRIVFTCGEQRDTITVSQSGGRPIIFMGSDTLLVSGVGGLAEAVVSSNFDFTSVMPQADWLATAQPDAALTRGVVKEQKVYFRVSANNTGADRTAQVIYSDPQSNLRDTLTILQGALMVLGDHELTTGPEAATLTIAHSSVTTYVMNTEAEWIAPDAQGNLRVQALPADSVQRQATVYCVNTENGVWEELSVTQHRPVIISSAEGTILHSVGLIAKHNYQLTAATIDGETEGIVWGTSNAGVATVSDAGLVSPIALGTATITATAPDGTKADCLVEVKEAKDYMDFMLSGSYALKDGVKENTVVCSMINRSVYQIRVQRAVINEGQKGAVTRTINQNVAVGDTVTTNATLEDMHPTFKWYFTISGTAYNVTATEVDNAIDKQARRKD